MLDSESPLRQMPYRWLVSGATINSFGNAISPVAIAFAVLDLGGTATQLGLVVGAYALADVIAVVLGGVLGDRLPRTTMMRASNATAALVQGVLAASVIGHWAGLWMVAVLSAVNGALGSLAGPSTQAITQQTVPQASLRQAITLRRLSQNIAQIAGAGAAGLLVASIGSGGALAIDACTFALAAACFTRISVPDLDRVPGGRPIAEAREGLREVMRRSWLWSLIAMAFVYHLFFGGAQGVLGPVVVGQRLGPAAWGYALSVMMIGFVSGGLLSLVWRPQRILLVGEFFLLLTICFPLAMALSTQLWVVLAGAFLHGFGLEIFSVGWDLAIQENIEPAMLARVYSFDQLGSFMARPVGLALTGPLSALTGARTWLVIIAIAMAASELVPFGIRDVRTLRRHAQTEQVPEAHSVVG